MEAAVAPLAVETVALEQAEGRFLAQPLIARNSAPRRDCSIMDGYAVSADDFVAGKWLACVGEVRAGQQSAIDLKPGEAVRIFTGAFLPAGADCVVMQEYAEQQDGQVRFRDGFGPSKHVRAAGSDFRQGDILVPAGARLTPQAMVAAAAADRARCEVTRRPRLAIIVTGDELVPPGRAMDSVASQPDSASYGVASLARRAGADVVAILRGGDDTEILSRLAEDALDRADCVVVTGGASVGAYDLARPMFAAHELREIFSRLPIRPGRPVWFGSAKGRPVLGLPGNPTSAMVTARLFLQPLLAALQGGMAGEELRFSPVRLATTLDEAGGRETFVRARATGDGLVPLSNQLSGAQSPLAQADWLIRCGAGEPMREAGELVSAIAF